MPTPESSAETSWRSPVDTRCQELFATRFGDFESCLFRWATRAEIDEAAKSGLSRSEQAELGEARAHQEPRKLTPIECETIYTGRERDPELSTQQVN